MSVDAQDRQDRLPIASSGIDSNMYAPSPCFRAGLTLHWLMDKTCKSKVRVPEENPFAMWADSKYRLPEYLWHPFCRKSFWFSLLQCRDHASYHDELLLGGFIWWQYGGSGTNISQALLESNCSLHLETFNVRIFTQIGNHLPKLEFFKLSK